MSKGEMLNPAHSEGNSFHLCFLHAQCLSRVVLGSTYLFKKGISFLAFHQVSQMDSHIFLLIFSFHPLGRNQKQLF